MTVAELMTRDVVTVDPDASLRELASLLATDHIGGVPVVVNDTILGVVSATDLLEFDADAPGSPRERFHQYTGFGEAPENLALDVEEGEEVPAAYFTALREDVGTDLVERFEEADTPEWNVLDEHVVSEVMTRKVFSITPGTGVQDAATQMLEADVHRALVVEDGRLLGVLTSMDVLRAVAERGLGA